MATFMMRVDSHELTWCHLQHCPLVSLPNTIAARQVKHSFLKARDEQLGEVCSNQPAKLEIGRVWYQISTGGRFGRSS